MKRVITTPEERMHRLINLLDEEEVEKVCGLGKGREIDYSGMEELTDRIHRYSKWVLDTAEMLVRIKSMTDSIDESEEARMALFPS
jgi:hypothetical protein